jgi:hypothetical protein
MICLCFSILLVPSHHEYVSSPLHSPGLNTHTTSIRPYLDLVGHNIGIQIRLVEPANVRFLSDVSKPTNSAWMRNMYGFGKSGFF